jgi:hypothetical protein
MQTFKIWLVKDPEIPELKKLSWEIVEVSVKDILENGIHPWSDRQANRTLLEKFLQVINSNDLKIKELAEFKYCEELSGYTQDYYYSSDKSRFEQSLDSLNQNLRFVESLDYFQLLELAKRNLQKKWNHAIAKQLTQRVYHNFSELRSFVKSKNRKVKLSSYEDLNSYNLGEILTLEDFKNEDQVLISEGLPATNFRSEAFIRRITDDRGLLRLTDTIDHFELQPNFNHPSYPEYGLHYSGQKKENKILLIPDLSNDLQVRAKAREVAQRWRTGQGRYCFTTDIVKLSEMLQEGFFQITIPGLDYLSQHEPTQVSATLHKNQLERYSIGSYLSTRSSADHIKEVLRNHSVSMTGTKEQLLEKLAKVSVEEYQKHEPELTCFFKDNRFLKMEKGYGNNTQEFPVLPNYDLRNMLLCMFVLRHLRGNAILDASYENDTYDLLSLAKSLIKGEVSLHGPFVPVVSNNHKSIK